MNEDRPHSGREVLDDAKQEAGRVARRLADEGRSMASQRKESAAGHADALGRALHKAADGLRDEDERRVADLAEMAADQIQSLGRALRERSVDELWRDSERLARRSPGTFFAGSIAVGFLLSRFLKSSQERRDHEQDLEPGIRRGGLDARSPSTVQGASAFDGAGGTDFDPDLPMGHEAGVTRTDPHAWPTTAGRFDDPSNPGERHAH